MEFEVSSRALLINTICRLGEVVYGRKSYVWYYTANGSYYDDSGDITSFIIRYFPGDCTYGEEHLKIKWSHEKDYRELSVSELYDVKLRNGLCMKTNAVRCL